MPIRPSERARYPKDWKLIRERILIRAKNRCEFCGVENKSFQIRDHGGWTKIVLTVAHLDHTPENCSDDNLKALCQRCHLAYDQTHHQCNARETRRRKADAKRPLLAMAQEGGDR